MKLCGGKQPHRAYLKLLFLYLNHYSSYIIESDCPIMAVTTSGSTAMSAAAEAGRAEMVRILMEKAQSDGNLDEICNVKVSC